MAALNAWRDKATNIGDLFHGSWIAARALSSPCQRE
jgi:hypothetical protein